MGKTKHKRDINIELLRIISMLLIVAQHCISHADSNSGLLLRPDSVSVNHLFSVLVGTWGRLSVEIFVFISAYYMLRMSNGFHSKKILKLGIQVWISCVVIAGVVYGLHLREFSLTNLAKELLTPAYPQYWFVTNYLLFYMLVPFLKIFVDNISDKQLKLCVLLLTIIIAAFRLSEGVSNLVYFCYLFLLAGMLREGNWFECHRKKIFPVLLFANVGLKLIIYDFGLWTEHAIPRGVNGVLEMVQSFCITAFAINMFFLFKNFKMNGKGHIINIFAPATLGVYIIHENILLRGETGECALIWDNVFHIGEKFYASAYFPLWVIAAVAITYIICSMLELVRIKIVDEGIINKIRKIDYLCNKIDKL